MSTVSESFGSMVFDDRVMRAALSKEVYDSLRKTIDEGAELNIGVANAVAEAMPLRNVFRVVFMSIHSLLGYILTRCRTTMI